MTYDIPYTLPDSWCDSSIGDVVVKTKQRDPRKSPGDKFLYVDVASVSNRLFTITGAMPLRGSDAHNQRLGLIVDLDTKQLSKQFLFNVFNTPHLRIEVAKTSNGSKVKHTSPTKLRSVKVGILPTIKDQDEIANALAAIDKKLTIATRKKSHLQGLFRTLLHELMTAKTRVDNVTLPKQNA